MTLVQHAGTTSTVSGPAALSTYRSASESLHPAHAEVHFNMYSSLGISAMVSNSCSDGNKIGERERRSWICHYLSSRLVKKVSDPARHEKKQGHSVCPEDGQMMQFRNFFWPPIT